MARTFRDRLTEIAMTVAGRDPSGEPAMPRTGTDRSTKRHMLALLIGTLAIMALGLFVAFTTDGPSEATGTPTVIVSPTTAGS